MLHPGEMGAAVGAVLVERGHKVEWRPGGRSEASSRRAADAGFRGVEDFADAEVILSISVTPFGPIS